MNFINSRSAWYRISELLAFGLFSGIPRKPGILLRRLFYRHLFARCGSAVMIERDVEWFGARRVTIDNEVFIGHNTCLDASTATSHIQLGARVNLRDNVNLNASEWNGHIVLHEGVTLDRGVDIKTHADGHIEIGKYTYISPYSCLAGPNITIGESCLIASHVSIYANNRNYADPTRFIGEQGMRTEGVVIEDDCWLGTGVKVLDGVTIGRGSVIGAGAVVTHDIPPYSVAVGVPARVVAQRGADHPATGTKVLAGQR